MNEYMDIILFYQYCLPFLVGFLSHPTTCMLEKWQEVTNDITYLLTPWSRVLLEKLTSKLCS